jgi:hypothetical protein
MPLESKEAWCKEARNILRSQIVRSGVSSGQLVGLLKAVGVNETVSGLKGKMHRGSFSFVFFIQVMRALGRDRIDIR